MSANKSKFDDVSEKKRENWLHLALKCWILIFYLCIQQIFPECLVSTGTEDVAVDKSNQGLSFMSYEKANQTGGNREEGHKPGTVDGTVQRHVQKPNEKTS